MSDSHLDAVQNAPAAVDGAGLGGGGGNGGAALRLGLQQNGPSPRDEAWRAARPESNQRTLQPEELREKLKPYRYASRQTMRSKMLAEDRDAQIARARDRLAEAWDSKAKREQWSDGAGFLKYFTESYRQRRAESLVAEATATNTTVAKGIAQTGKNAHVKARSNVQRLALHRDRYVKLKRLKELTDTIVGKKETVARLRERGVTDATLLEAEYVLEQAELELARVVEEVADIVDLQRGRLADVMTLDGAFDDAGVGEELSKIAADLDDHLDYLTGGRGPRDGEGPETARRITGRLDALWGLQELDVLTELNSARAMNEAARADADPGLGRERRFRDTVELVKAHEKEKDLVRIKSVNRLTGAPESTVLDEPAEYARTLHPRLRAKGLASDFERRAMNVRRDAVARLKSAAVDCGGLAFANADFFEASNRLGDAIDRQTYHRRRADIRARTAPLRRRFDVLEKRFRLRPELTTDRHRDELGKLASALTQLGTELHELDTSELAAKVRARNPGDAQNPPTAETIQSEVELAFLDLDALVDEQKADARAQGKDADLVDDAMDALRRLIDDTPTALWRGRGEPGFLVSDTEIDQVFSDLRDAVDLEQDRRDREAQQPLSRGQRLWRTIKAGVAKIFSFGVISERSGLDELKGLTKAGAGGTEAAIWFNEERGNALDMAGLRRIEREEMNVHQLVDDMKKALHTLEFVEHFAGAGAAFVNIHRAGQEIAEKKETAEHGKAMLEMFDKELAAKQGPVQQARYKTRHGVARHLGHRLLDQDMRMEQLDRIVAGGQAARHLGQNAGRAIAQYGPHVIAHGGTITGVVGLGGAVVFEGGEAALASVQAHRSRMEAKELQKRLDDRAVEIQKDYPNLFDAPRLNAKGLIARLGALEDDAKHYDELELNSLRRDVEDLRNLKASVDTLKARKDVGEKIAVATRSGAATGAYAAAFGVGVAGLAGATGGVGLAAAPIAMGGAGLFVLVTHGYRQRKHAARARVAAEARQAVTGTADADTVAGIREAAAKKGISAEDEAWERMTAADPSNRAALLQQALIAETGRSRLSDADIAERVKLADEADTALAAWKEASKQFNEIKQKGAGILSRHNAGRVFAAADEGELNRTKRAIKKAEKALAPAQADYETKMANIHNFDRRRDDIFDRSSERYSPTADFLRNYVGMPAEEVFSMIDAGSHANDPDAAKLSHALILSHLGA